MQEQVSGKIVETMEHSNTQQFKDLGNVSVPWLLFSNTNRDQYHRRTQEVIQARILMFAIKRLKLHFDTLAPVDSYV